MDQLFDPHKYNHYREDSQWMMLKRNSELALQRIMNGVADTATRTMAQTQKGEGA